MNPNIDALRLKERREIAYWVNDFLEDSDAIQAMKGRGIPWRIQALAEMGFLESVERCKQWEFLLYLHDASSVKKGGAL